MDNRFEAAVSKNAILKCSLGNQLPPVGGDGNEVGEGSAFKVMLPAGSESANAGAQAEAETGTNDLWRGHGMVLLADDEPSMLALGKRMLERSGFTALLVNDGLEALEAFREHKDDIICTVLDLTMPRMSGADACREIRRIDPEAKIILSSGYGGELISEEFTGSGLTGFLPKPYTLQGLKTKLREILG